MDSKKLKQHITICIRGLKSKRNRCCANCPFEEEILAEYPELKDKFEQHRIDVFNKVSEIRDRRIKNGKN